MRGIRYKIFYLIESFGILLEASYKIHGYRQNRLMFVKRIGYKIENWATDNIYKLIENESTPYT